MNKFRIIVFAYSQLGHDCLKFLIEQNCNIMAVFTHPDQSTQENIWFESVASISKKYDIPVYVFDNPNHHIDFIEKLQPDLVFSFYYRHMLSEQVLQIPKLGAFNMHGSLLPKYRGRCPINWAIIMGEKESGATLHYMVAKADAGDIVDQEVVTIDNIDNAGQLTSKITKAALIILERFLFNLQKGFIKRNPQNLIQGRYFGGRSEQDSLIDWNKSAWQVHNLIRALQPYPNYPPAFTFSPKEKILLIESLPPTAEFFSKGAEGEILEINEKYFKVCCSNGEILIITQAVIVPNNNGQKNLDEMPNALKFLTRGQILRESLNT